ncbi:MAG: hypothetical protein ACI9YM_000407 [Brevundimonas sp.]|jgi:hypothetical protein|uniref:hypothetical protein n=1 Tax=Brevundimonas sp. TaxID=1871086 RepID=UPI00248A0B2E|nr:hypothetical protein [Brevundimonas sp.]MDI1282476.1 hypothetical protein [Brevundimonas sp.]
MRRALVAAAACLPLLTGCVIYADDSGETTMVRMESGTAITTTGPAETLRAVRFADGRLIAQVESNGCTTAADFAVSVAEGTPVDITLTRTRPDPCKAIVPDGVELSWTYAELGLTSGEAAHVANPLRL